MQRGNPTKQFFSVSRKGLVFRTTETEPPTSCVTQPRVHSEEPSFPFSRTAMLSCLKARQTVSFHCPCLESTHLDGAPRDRPVHIIADNEVPVQDCVLVILRILLLGECWLEPDMCLEEQSKLPWKGTTRPTPLLCAHWEVRFPV